MMFFRRHNDLKAIQPGSTFRRVHGDYMVETAEVLAVEPDSHGIPHVRFNVDFKRISLREHSEGPRTLALSRFADLYKIAS